jgi:hypothetical protein
MIRTITIAITTLFGLRNRPTRQGQATILLDLLDQPLIVTTLRRLARTRQTAKAEAKRALSPSPNL